MVCICLSTTACWGYQTKFSLPGFQFYLGKTYFNGGHIFLYFSRFINQSWVFAGSSCLASKTAGVCYGLSQQGSLLNSLPDRLLKTLLKWTNVLQMIGLQMKLQLTLIGLKGKSFHFNRLRSWREKIFRNGRLILSSVNLFLSLWGVALFRHNY